MSEDTAPDALWLQWPHGWEKYGTIERSLVSWDFQRVWNGDVEYIRADVAQAQLDAANARIAELEDEMAQVNRAAEFWREDAERAHKRIAELEEALRECADDLESEVDARYAPLHPAMEHRHSRDMEPVRKARSLLHN